jgi:hypothetical protein
MILGPPITPLELYWANDETLTTTTQAPPNWVQKMRLTIPATTAGTFRIAWTAEWTIDDENNPAFIRLHLDDATEIGYYAQAVKKKYAPGTPLTEYWYVLAGFHYQVLDQSGHTIDMDIAVGGGKTIYCRSAHIDAMRIA